MQHCRFYFKPEQSQEAKPDMEPTYEQNMLDDKRRRRIISNRLSAQRSRLKKLRSFANVEFQAKFFEDQIAELQQQHASYENHKQLLMAEEQKLKQEMEFLQTETLLIDAEIEKNKGEANRLREFLVMKQQQLQTRLFNENIDLPQPPSNGTSSSNYFANSFQGEWWLTVAGCSVAGNGRRGSVFACGVVVVVTVI
ncbi:hypothetical protein Fmac_014210 [Flemingia macrophylla]|uniref:BZIP domain-containing protein n=1 Tax=Flemingia macrophylla TaxID=520843 RepID=A0ABD1MB18_9FABA